ncbi:hypothetical protein OT109_13705 [Phycisphaeraceae bacterium D3-23]
MLVVMGGYLVGCYAYGVYLLVKVYTGRRMDRRSVAVSRDQPGITLRGTPDTGPAAARHNDQPDQAKAA